jgi:hypothetical protein
MGKRNFKGENKMKTKDYHKGITAKITSEEAFKNIANVAGWWTSHFKGNTANVNDTFRVTFGENWFSFKVIESVPNKRSVWLCTDCSMVWLNNRNEWKGTKIVWEISEYKNGIKIDMTHVGLVSSTECYGTCSIGWENYIGESLPKLIKTGKGVLFDD